VPRATRHQHARADILEAAARIFARHGYNGTSMRELARATGRGLSSFYNYFPSKDAALFALQLGAFDMLNASAAAAVATSRTPDAQLYAFILNHVRYLTSHFEVMRVLVHEAKELPTRQRRQVRMLKEQYYRTAEQVVRRLMKERTPAAATGNGGSRVNGSRRAEQRAELERTTYAMFGMLNWIYGWYDPSRHGSAVDLARSIHRTALSGMGGRGPARGTYERVEREFERLEMRALIAR
jgi:AcrR family transcriptional regulator